MFESKNKNYLYSLINLIHLSFNKELNYYGFLMKYSTDIFNNDFSNEYLISLFNRYDSKMDNLILNNSKILNIYTKENNFYYRNISLINLLLFGGIKFPKLEKITFIPGGSFDLLFVNSIICLYETISEGKSPFIDINQISLDNSNLLLSNIEKIWINNNL